MSRPPLRTTGRLLAVVVCLLLCAAGVAVAAQGAAIQGVSFSGDGVVGADQGVTYLAGWQSQRLNVSLDLQNGSYVVCADVGTGEETNRLSCQTVTAADGTQTVTFTVEQWPANATGQQTLSVAVSNGSGEPLDTASRQLQVLSAGGDFDGDGLGNRDELDRGTNARVADTDGDDLDDGREVNQLGTNATNTDTDGDGLSDGVEFGTGNGYQTNPTEPDTDGDGLNDGAEQTSHGTDPTTKDTDGDGLEDGREINTYETNPTAEDSDGDGLSDGQEVNVHGTDPASKDTDGDGLDDGQEINGGTGYETNASSSDTDADGLDDGTEVNEYGTDPTTKDTDGDGVNDADEIEAGSDPGEGQAPPGTTDGLQLDDMALVGGLLALYALVIGAVIWVGRSRAGGAGDEPTDSGAALEEADDGRDVPPAGDDPTDQPSPMTNEDRVRQMLDERGGRLKQSDIVARTDWSKSKVSRLLSKMESDDEIRKISIGRENLITRPGDEPESARSPFEEQD